MLRDVPVVKDLIKRCLRCGLQVGEVRQVRQVRHVEEVICAEGSCLLRLRGRGLRLDEGEGDGADGVSGGRGGRGDDGACRASASVAAD